MEDSSKKLDKKIYEKIVRLCHKGNRWEDEENYNQAIYYFEKAFHLSPIPKTDWEAGNWILTAIGDCYFFNKEYEKALESLRHSEIYPKGDDTGFQQLRIGQSYLELNKIKDAQEYLMRAYLLGNEEIFKGEDLKYWNLLQPLL